MKDVALKYFATSNRTVGYFVPTSKPERTPVPAVPDIAKLVEGYTGRQLKGISSEESDVSPLGIEARLKRPEPIAGVKLALLPKKTRNEAVFLTLALHYGNAENLKGLVDASSFLGELLTRGTKNLTRQQIQDALDKNFTRLSSGAGARMRMMGGGSSVGTVGFSLETKRANLAAAIEILRQILREPTLPDSEFEVMKNEQIAGAEQGRSDPLRQGFNHIQRLLSQYPSDDVRYVPTIDEQVERLKKVTALQVKSLYQDYLGADHGELVIVGDFEPSEILPLLAKTFDGWTSKKPYARIERPYQPDLKIERETVLTPDKENAAYMAGMSVPIKDDNPDYPALVAGNFIQGGGGLSSRLADRLRQKGGLSYTAMSVFAASPLEPRGDLLILAIYNPANLPKVVAGVDDELERLLRDGVQPAELERAKTGYVQQRTVQRAGDQLLASMLAEDLFVGRTMQFQADLEQRIKELTPVGFNAALRKYIDLKRLSVVTAGDFKK